MDGKLRNMASIYILNNDKMLLLYRIGSRVVQPSWCGIGGHFEKEELNDARAAVLRELKEEIDLTEEDLNEISLRYVTLRLINGEIRLNYYFFATLKEGIQVNKECSEGILEWVPTSEVKLRSMPFTAEYVLKHYMETGMSNNHLYAVVATDDRVEFVILSEF